MEWLDRLNQAVDYIEQNIDRDINYDHLGISECTWCFSLSCARRGCYLESISTFEFPNNNQRRCGNELSY